MVLLCRAEVRLSDTIHDMKAYVQVTDWVYQQVLHSRDPRLAGARALLGRIERRQLYKCIGQSRPADKAHKLQRIVSSVAAVLLRSYFVLF